MMRPGRKLRVSDDVAGLIRGLHPEIKRKVKAGLRMIASDPDVGKALRDELRGLRSFRLGKFRIIYRALRGRVEIVALGPRERIYEETYRLLQKEKP